MPDLVNKSFFRTHVPEREFVSTVKYRFICIKAEIDVQTKCFIFNA